MQKYLWKKSGLVVIGMLYLFLAWKGKRMIMVSGQELVEEPQEARKVALTFDDGPSEYTVELSRGLKERGVQATFFLLGENMEGRRKMVEELVKELDPQAFMIVTSANEIYGEGYKSFFADKFSGSSPCTKTEKSQRREKENENL